MKRINKRSVLTAVLAFMLVLSFGFYTGLSPTTAWFSDSGNTSGEFDIGTFDVSSEAYVHEDMTLHFDVTTKLSEALETQASDAATRNKEFEYAVQYIYLTLENGVEPSRTSADYLDALVNVEISSAATDDGLRYFCFAMDEDESDEDGYYNAVTGDANGKFTSNGALSSKIRSYCTANSISTDADLMEAMADNELRVAHGDSVNFCIALWVDHGDSGVVDTTFPITVTVTSTQALAE